jgi:hypothetical protein
MKTVFNRDNVAHLWAHKAQDTARVASGNFYFSGPTLYSYGSHFVCAHHMPDAYRRDDNPLVLVNAGTYSMTTNRHMSAMRHALPRYFETIAVPGLDANKVTNIPRWGALEVSRALRGAFVSHMKEAATERNVMAGTRADSLRSAELTLRDLRHLLTVDASRRDIGAQTRKDARAMLRSLPASCPDVLTEDRKGARVIAQAFAARVVRSEYRDDAKRLMGAAVADAAMVEQYITGATTELPYYLRTATDALRHVGATEQAWRDAEHAAKLGGLRLPAASRRKVADAIALRPALEAQRAAETRAEDLRLYAQKIEGAASHAVANPRSWCAEHLIMEARRLAISLAETDTDSEKSEREETLRRLESDLARMRAADAPQRYATAMQRARDALLASGNLRVARDYLQTARLCLSDDTDAARGADMMQIAEAITAAEEMANADAIAAWRDGGASVPFRTEYPLLRLRGDEIETSHGASVPASVAPMVWRAVNAAREAGARVEYPRGNAPRLGPFTLDEITAQGDVIAGCHHLRYAELQDIARRLGFVS